MKRFLRCGFLLAAACSLAACAGHLKVGPGWEGEEVVAEGMAPFDGKDLPAAKAAALAAAQRRAVEQVVGVFVSGQTQVQQAMAIQQKVLSRTQGFVKRYTILKEGREGDYWKTNIRAVVLVQDVGALLDELKIVERPKNVMRALILVKESVQDGQVQDNAAGQGISRALTKKPTVTVIDRPADSEEAKDEQGAVELGSRLGAGVVILGSVNAYKMEGVSQLGAGFVPYRARAGLKAIATGNGQLIAEASREASGIDPVENISARKALASAGELAGQELSQALDRALKSGVAITVKIMSLPGLEQLKKLQEMMRNVPGVDEVALNRYSRGDAELSVYAGSLSGEELAASILRAKPFPIDTQSVSQFEVVLKVME